MKKIFILSLVLLIALGIIAYSARGAIYDELNALKLIPLPETFTELYFNTYPQDQSQMAANTHVSFTFVIHNLEGTTTAYAYSVYFVSKNGTTTIARKSVTLADNASTTVAESLTLASAYEPGEVFVSIPALDQHIDFYIPQD